MGCAISRMLKVRFLLTMLIMRKEGASKLTPLDGDEFLNIDGVFA